MVVKYSETSLIRPGMGLKYLCTVKNVDLVDTDLDPNSATPSQTIDRFHSFPHDGIGCYSDEVVAESFRYKWKRSGHS